MRKIIERMTSDGWEFQKNGDGVISRYLLNKNWLWHNSELPIIGTREGKDYYIRSMEDYENYMKTVHG